jgi:hypothetical protein
MNASARRQLASVRTRHVCADTGLRSRGRALSKRTLGCVCADALCLRSRELRPRGRIFTSADGKIRPPVKSHPRADIRTTSADVRTVNFTVGRPFRHSCV